MTLYEEIIKKAEEGYSVYINIKKRRLQVDGTTWVDETGATKHSPKERDVIARPQTSEEAMKKLEELYKEYKYSYPDMVEVKRKHNLFKALTAEEMTDEEMVLGEDRYVARIKLEVALLLYSVTGYLKWKGGWGSWFYQGKDKDFIVLREWIMFDERR